MQDYLNTGILSAVVSIIVIYVIWLLSQHVNNEDESDDIDEIKETLNPDVISSNQRGWSDMEKRKDECRHLSEEELQYEKKIQEEQLTSIFQMMENNKETYGVHSLNDIKEQLRLYKTQ